MRHTQSKEEEIQRKLRERIKELGCLYTFSELKHTNAPDIPIFTLLADMMPINK